LLLRRSQSRGNGFRIFLPRWPPCGRGSESPDSLFRSFAASRRTDRVSFASAFSALSSSPRTAHLDSGPGNVSTRA
jgi:hypothetical protein